MRGLVRGRRSALQVVWVWREMRVLSLSVLGRRGQALVWGRASMLTHRWTLETQGGRLQRLPTPRGLLLGLEQTLVPSLSDRRFVRPYREKKMQGDLMFTNQFYIIFKLS